jgi:maleylacetoacetate isomerase
MPYQLLSYFRSSASWRVRIALALKGLAAEYHGVHLVKKENLGHPDLGPAQRVPALLTPEGARLTQSLAILEYLEERHPEPPLLPREPLARAFARSLALDIACEIHPLNNLAVLRQLMKQFGADETAKTAWMGHWMEEGLAVVEQRLQTEGHSAAYCVGDAPGYADCLLVPQVFNAQRWGARIEHLEAVQRIHARCLQHPAFADTHPSKVPDAE